MFARRKRWSGRPVPVPDLLTGDVGALLDQGGVGADPGQPGGAATGCVRRLARRPGAPGSR